MNGIKGNWKEGVQREGGGDTGFMVVRRCGANEVKEEEREEGGACGGGNEGRDDGGDGRGCGRQRGCRVGV